MSTVEKVYPSAEELSKTNKGLRCPECTAIFNSDSNLNLHLAKTHKKPHLLQTNSANKIYHCPVSTCAYNNASHFKQYKFLKQHYLKVHSEKKFICGLCNKGFATESFKNRHTEYCNISFKCCDCDSFYPCYETLKTHSRRKKHRILEKPEYKKSDLINNLKTSKSETALASNKAQLLLPKPSKSMEMFTVAETLEQSCQTENLKILRNTQETQTLEMKIPYFTVETQTIGDYFTKKPGQNNTSKNTKTQTFTTSPKTVSCSTTHDIENFEIETKQIKRNSSSTQTNICNLSDFNYSSSANTHTDTSDLLSNDLDTSFFNCNTETQTDSIFNDDLFKCDYSTSIYTQTCDDLLLGEIELNNTYTQTVFDDVLRSVESQTTMSHSKILPLSCKDMSHIETQTDLEFKQMLEEINV